MCHGRVIRRATPAGSMISSAQQNALVFVNTRIQAELIFQELWQINDDNLPIALHHGRSTRAATQGRGRDDAWHCAPSSARRRSIWESTGAPSIASTVGAPKGAARLVQRIGRANHRLDEASRALLVPGNRFEVLECTGGTSRRSPPNAQDTPPLRTGALDVLAQLRPRCAHAVSRFVPKTSMPRCGASRALPGAHAQGLRRCRSILLRRVVTALKSYERFAKIRQSQDGLVARLRIRVAGSSAIV